VIAVDTSVLAYAVNRFAPQHARATQAVETLANGDAAWALPWSVVYEFLRLVTHPHAAARPLKLSDAWGFAGELMTSPSVHVLGPGERHQAALVEVLGMVSGETGLPAGLETAVLLREHGVRELLSADRGMRRFAFLDVVDPVAGGWAPGGPPVRRYRRLALPGRGG
jgi:predicted nucleic acid-binding protein